MESIEDLYNLRDELRDVGFCNLTTQLINDKLNNSVVDIFLIEEYETSGSLSSYLEYTINKIDEFLQKYGYITMAIRNSSGDDATLAHVFALFLIAGDCYRMESYGKTTLVITRKKVIETCSSLYKTRIVEWNTYDTDIIKLFKMPSGPDRLSYWNGLFSSNEQHDIEGDLDITLTVVDENFDEDSFSQ